MKYELTTPCENCPFKKDQSYLATKRASQIARDLQNDHSFACHKTTTSLGRRVDHPKAQHCAGALIMLEKLDKPHQMMRIAERLRLYDPFKLDMEAPVFDNFKQFIKSHKG